eukprot:1161181-Pelagomonas_calceolata.AAC.3
MSWCAVVKYHGPRPTPGPDKVWVANHTSMIDYTILCSHSPFAVIMQCPCRHRAGKRPSQECIALKPVIKVTA